MKTYKKYLILGSFLAVFIAPAMTDAVTIEELQAKIRVLLAQIQQLQSRVGSGQSNVSVPENNPEWCHEFVQPLKKGFKSKEVRHLHIALEKDGFSVASEEKINGLFGDSTKAAVISFQEKYREEILVPAELESGNGVVGKLTRNKLNSLYRCSTYKITPSGTIIRGKEYDFAAKIEGRVNSAVLFFLERPSGTMKYDGINGSAIGRGDLKTDSKGLLIVNSTQLIPTGGEIGDWFSWITVGGIKSNEQKHKVISTPGISCVKEGESLGAVVPDNTKQCCAGLVPYIEPGIVGTRGVCIKPETSSSSIELSADKTSGIAPLNVNFGITLKNFPACTSYNFDFGDGVGLSLNTSCLATSTASIPVQTFAKTYTYRTTGTYKAFVAAGDKKSDKLTINVNSVPVPSSVSGIYNLGPVETLVKNKTYDFVGQIFGAQPKSKVYFYLKRPDGTMKYNGEEFGNIQGDSKFSTSRIKKELLSLKTDSLGFLSGNVSQKIPAATQIGEWLSWVGVGGVGSTIQKHLVVDSGTPIYKAFVYDSNGGLTDILSKGKSYNLAGQISNAKKNSKINFYLKRPDGTMKYNGEDANDIKKDLKSSFGRSAETGKLKTDLQGNKEISVTQKINLLTQTGEWVSWVAVDGVKSNEQKYKVAESGTPVYKASIYDYNNALVENLILAKNKTYTFTGQVFGAKKKSKINFYLKRPDGTMKYDGVDINDIQKSFISSSARRGERLLDIITDSQGGLKTGVSVSQKIPSQTQNGEWVSWVVIDGVKSNEQKFIVTDIPVYGVKLNQESNLAGEGDGGGNVGGIQDTPRGGD